MSRNQRTKNFNIKLDLEWKQKILDFLKDYFHKDLNWTQISMNKNISMDIIKDNPDKPWNWYGVSRNPNITWDIIENNLDKTSLG